MPEGDALRRAAARLQVLAGDVVAAESPHPRAQLLGLAEALDGRRLEHVEAVGKNLLLTFDGGLVLRSHLRMKGRWHVRPLAHCYVGRPWLVLRGREWQALQWNGPVLELSRRRPDAVRRLGPDIMDVPPDLDAMIARLRAADPAREVGSALLDQRLVAGIGNMWKAEALWLAGVSPWTRVADLSEGDRAASSLRLPRRCRRTARGASTGGQAPRAAGAASSSAPGRRATRPARRTGARAARQERSGPGRNEGVRADRASLPEPRPRAAGVLPRRLLRARARARGRCGGSGRAR